MITSISNPRVKKLRELMGKARLRKEEGVFIAEGLRMVSETPADRLKELYISESFTDRSGLYGIKAGDDRTYVLSDDVFRRISDTKNPQGILAVVRRSDISAEDILKAGNPFILFLEDIQDPGNLGTMVRTAEAAGITGIIMSSDTVDIYNMKVVRATMGCMYRMPFACAGKGEFEIILKMAREKGIGLYAAYLDSDEIYTDVSYASPCGIIIGNEGRGLKPSTAMLADKRIRIPMSGEAESLNAAMAAGIIMYEARRQRT